MDKQEDIIIPCTLTMSSTFMPYTSQCLRFCAIYFRFSFVLMIYYDHDCDLMMIVIIYY